MRSSKSRSRSKANRPRTLGNIVNRVFDSSGPEGKVRGTPQQIIEKYQMLARDAQLSNDRVAAENFSQHAEHYTRMLAEAQREMAAEQEQRQQQHNNNQQGNGNGNRDRQNDRSGEQRNDRGDYRPERGDASDQDQPYASGFAVVGEEEAGLVDLPEANRQPPRREDRRDDRRDARPDANARRQDSRRDDRPKEPRPEAAPKAANDTSVAAAESEAKTTPEPQTSAPAEPAEKPLRFESPAAVVAQVEEAAAKPKVVKPRAPRSRKPAAQPDASVDPKGDTPETVS